MRKSSRLLLAALTAALMLAFATSSATAARSIEIRGGRSTSFAFNELAFTAGGLAITCAVTLLATISTLIPKTPEGVLIGRLTGIRLVHPNRCRAPFFLSADAFPLGCSEEAGGLCTVNTADERWKLRYHSFTGTLPSVTGFNISIERTQFLVSTPVGRCLYEGRAFGRINIVAGAVTTAQADTAATRLRLITRLSGECPEPGSFAGRSGNSSLRLTIALL